MWDYYNAGQGIGKPALGKSNIKAPLNSLVAVFLSDADPRTLPTVSALDFSSASSRNFKEIRPKLGQVCFVGDGLTSDGIEQKFHPPAGATRLFLCTMDGYEWTNNGGAFQTTVFEAGRIALVQ